MSPRGGAKKREPLVVPEWLAELAARDHPPTVIEGELRGRLFMAGVDALLPVAATATPHVYDVVPPDLADHIGTWGPGFGRTARLGDEPAPVMAALQQLLAFLEPFDRLRRVRLAAADMREVESTARVLAIRDGPARMFESMLVTGLIVTYARTYLPSNETGGIGPGGAPKGADRALHDGLIEARGRDYAHAERTGARTLVDTAEYVGFDGPPIFSELSHRFSPTQLEATAELARRQAERFEREGDELGRELGERHDDDQESPWSIAPE